MKIIKQGKTKEELDAMPVDRWISVEDRLPEVGKQVYVYIKRPDDFHDNVEKAHLSDKSDDEYPYWVFDNSRFYSTRFRYVTHWSPKDGDI